MKNEEKLTDLIESPRLGTFSKWEQDFLYSLESGPIDSDEELTKKQSLCLDSIYKKYFVK